MLDRSSVQSTSNPAVAGIGAIPDRLRRRQRRFGTVLVGLMMLCGAEILERVGLAELVHWLGKFHPPLVHLPIAMLMAAALAEFLLIKTRRPAFGIAARYCLWVGAVAAAVAAVSGWFFGGMQWTDGDWVMTTHRWIGTATAAWSVLVLILGELNVRRNSRATQVTYRLTLLLGAGLVGFTGFLGGSLIYGLDHYAW